MTKDVGRSPLRGSGRPCYAPRPSGLGLSEGVPNADEFVAVNHSEGLALSASGGAYPITKYLDGNGEECELPDAAMAIAGFDYSWFWIDLRDFGGTVQ